VRTPWGKRSPAPGCSAAMKALQSPPAVAPQRRSSSMLWRSRRCQRWGDGMRPRWTYLIRSRSSPSSWNAERA
jgi:hypothetical protein